METVYRFCPCCAAPLALITGEEDGGPKQRLRCTACDFTHWNNPTPVLAAVVECVDREGYVLLARNAAWPGRRFALITGFMEAGESPEEGIAREIAEETNLKVTSLKLVATASPTGRCPGTSRTPGWTSSATLSIRPISPRVR